MTIERVKDSGREDLLQSLSVAYLIGLIFFATSVVSKSEPTTETLTHRISEKIIQVKEFEFIRSEAERLGVRVWLFGGTAASFAHYAKWDLERGNSTKTSNVERFDYDFTNIFRATQDLDLVVDGKLEDIEKLERSIVSRFPSAQGGKSDWELRPLKQARENKIPLLENPDFLNQHTDSHSTGLIEITKPINHDPLIRDLRDWNGVPPKFLNDVVSGELHYYFSPSHNETSRAKSGLNPPILSVIRYLTKAFQYKLKIQEGDLAILKRIIAEFQPGRVQAGYVAEWIERNGKKLFQNANDIEYAWDTLEALGLRSKLIQLKNDFKKEGSLAWWMLKEPLRSQPIGGGKGKTARDLGITEVAHETRSFLAYESITRSHLNDANVFISRGKGDVVGETAMYGDGFYTRIGRQGAVGSQITIRFAVDPNAEEGKDFKVVEKNFVVFLNKRALKVVPETIQMTPEEYIEFLIADQSLPENERALLEKFRRRIRNRFQALDDEKRNQLEHRVVEHAANNNAAPLVEFMRIFGGLSESLRQNMIALPKELETKLIEKIMESPTIFQDVVKDILFSPVYDLPEQWRNAFHHVIKKLLQTALFEHRTAREMFEKLMALPPSESKLREFVTDHIVMLQGEYPILKMHDYFKERSETEPASRRAYIRTLEKITGSWENDRNGYSVWQDSEILIKDRQFLKDRPELLKLMIDDGMSITKWDRYTLPYMLGLVKVVPENHERFEALARKILTELPNYDKEPVDEYDHFRARMYHLAWNVMVRLKDAKKEKEFLPLIERHAQLKNTKAIEIVKENTPTLAKPEPVVANTLPQTPLNIRTNSGAKESVGFCKRILSWLLGG